MKSVPILAALLAGALAAGDVSAQEVPRVYDVENTGVDCPAPALPGFRTLPAITALPDPFAWSDTTRGRISSVDDWRCRRAEIAAEIQHYETGNKPAPPDDLEVSYADGQLTITVTEGEDSLTLTAPVSVPAGEGPFPAVIGVGSRTGSLPSDIFTSRDVATVQFNVGDISGETHTGNRTGAFYRLFEDGTAYGASIGKMAAWAWGISRIIDALERTPELNIDPSRLAVTGCSYAGKISLFTGALDERIALTIAQEPGGGGAAAWRVSDALPYQVETLNATNGSWFSRTFQPLFGPNPEILPYDHHELMAMVAPRALLVINNSGSGYNWLAAESAHVSNAAAQEVWTALGVPDRFGYAIADVSHCAQLQPSQRGAVEAFVDKFLLGIASADTDVAVTPYTRDVAPWITWDTPELSDASTSTGSARPAHGPISLSQSYPNPFVASTAIEYVVDQPAHVELAVYNALGQRVRTLVDGVQPAGEHTAVWEGTDDLGRPLPSGVYFYTLRSGAFGTTGTAVRVR